MIVNHYLSLGQTLAAHRAEDAPQLPWGEVVRVLNRGQATSWTVERLQRRPVAGIKAAAPDRTFQQIAAQLEPMRERTPRGGTRWHPSSVKHLLVRAERFGLAGTASVKVGPGNPVA